MNIQLAVFDIAGTTVTDKGNINDIFRKAFSNAGLPDVIGYSKIEAIEIIVEKYNPDYVIDSHQFYLN